MFAWSYKLIDDGDPVQNTSLK